MMLFSRKNIYIYLLLTICYSTLFAEISTGILFIHKDTTQVNKNAIVINKSSEELPKTSGLKLFAGDKIQTGNETVTVVIPNTSLLLRLFPYSEVNFDIEEIGGLEFIIKVSVIFGTIKAERHDRGDLLQILVDIEPPQTVERSDGIIDTSDFVNEVYVHIINVNASIESHNFDISSGVFITEPGIDIKEIIRSLTLSLYEEDTGDILSLPETSVPLSITHNMRVTSYLYNGIEDIYMSGLYSLSLYKDKFATTLQLPLFFNKDNSWYNPLGANDMLFGSEVWRDQYQSLGVTEKILINTNGVLISMLNKIKNLSYGTPQDSIYVRYGAQDMWHNSRSTLFAYKYFPVTTTPNNFNPDVVFNLNLNKFGNTTRIRMFQPATYHESIFTTFDLLYNRTRINPLIPFNTLEIGISFAIDMYLDKYSKSLSSLLGVDTTANRLAFFSLDTTIPIVNLISYSLEIKTEAGMLFPISQKGITMASSISNFGAKAGVNNTLYFSKNVSLKIEAIGNISRGFFRPHFAGSGYEYFTKPVYNILVSQLALSPSYKDFQAFFLTPELDVSINAEPITLNIGTYVPLSGETQASVFNLNPAVFVDIAMYFVRLPYFLDMSSKIRYVNQNLDMSTWDWANTLEHLGEMNSVFEVKVETLILGKFGIDFGVFNTPKYKDTELEYTSEGQPLLTTISYVSFYLQL